MVERKIGLSREFVIHPGETLNDILMDRGISQVELANRTGVTEAHISNILNGQKSISTQFAKKLEYALGTEAKFWINLQANYDAELLDFQEQNGVSEEEISILDHLRVPVTFLKRIGLIPNQAIRGTCVIELRKLFEISSLTNIPKLAFSGAFRISQNTSYDVYVLFAWIKLCQILTSHQVINTPLNIQKLKESLPAIKAAMWLPADQVQGRLGEIFASCGVSFCIAKNFPGAPVHGYIKRNHNGTALLAVTIRYSSADIFWFSLFHEIGHLVNEDLGSSNSFIDYAVDSSSEIEVTADVFAANYLIPAVDYNHFVALEDFSLEAINAFAHAQNIPNYIVIGRLHKEKIIPYNQYSDEKLMYKWAE
jgi:HTH-type transcriptional regulator / antitoxin HigA